MNTIKDNNNKTDNENESLDIDVNLVDNFLQSISLQHDLAGPASNLHCLRMETYSWHFYQQILYLLDFSR